MRLASSVLGLLLVLSACAAETAAPDELATATGETYDTSRIVTLGGPLTEITYALGMGDSVVGTDKSSLYPEAVNALPRLDVYRQTSPEGVLSLTPTLVVALEGTGPAGVVEQIESAGVAVVLLPESSRLEDATDRIQQLGKIYGADQAADSLAAQLRDDVAAAEPPAEAPRALFVYARGAAVVLVSGTGNDIDAAMTLAGAANAVTAFEGFRPLTAEAVANAAPDVIILPNRGLESLGGIDGLLDQPGLRQTPAGRNRRVIGVDDGMLLGFGPRAGQGIQDLARQLADLPTDP